MWFEGLFRSPGMRGALTLFACVSLAGCSGKDDNPVAPGPPVITPISVTAAWPHADNQSFAYKFTARVAPIPPPTLYPLASQVPQVTLDQVAALLLTPGVFTPDQEAVVGYILTFSDSLTGPGGVRGQNLIWATTSYPIPALPAPGSQAQGFTPPPPALLRGGVWRQEPTLIGLYNQDSAEPSWVFLQGALADRTPWEARLLPGLADDVVMRARAYQSVSIDIAGFRRDDALDVHYLMDLGIVAVTDGGGGVLGYMRGYNYGRVIWAEGVGPVYLYERTGLSAGDPNNEATGECTLLLENVTFPFAF